MQRLFSTFPNSWPGRALLLLRIATAIPLLERSLAFICGMTHASILGIELIGLACAALLIVGFYTPLAALVQVGLEIWMASQGHANFEEHCVLVAVGISLMMLGPGAWSVDAHLFGRKRIDLRSD